MKSKIFEFANLHHGEEDKNRVLENVKSNIAFKGSNLWILACAIIIASIGLNVNSTAVIIGAMLISPLMGPIVGAGFALGTFDIELLRRSFKNLMIATAVSLTVSTLYFSISPFKDTQSELLARTSPNIYDVLIAFFGGLVGVIAITRVEKGNPIPGVAIATALMPPLCTAGYGLAIGNIPYFLGAFYLYAINCVFICIATYLIVKYLNYPPIKMPDAQQQKRIRYGISIIITLMIIPGSYLAYDLFKQKSYSRNIEQFINTEFPQSRYTIVYKHITYHTSPKKIELAFLHKRFDRKERNELEEKMERYGITNTKLIIRQDSGEQRQRQLTPVEQTNTTSSETKYKSIENEVCTLIPDIQDISIGKHYTGKKETVVMLYRAERPLTHEEVQALKNWLRAKTSFEEVRVMEWPND